MERDVMLGLDPSISGQSGASFCKRFPGLRFAPPENDALHAGAA